MSLKKGEGGVSYAWKIQIPLIPPFSKGDVLSIDANELLRWDSWLT